MNDNPSPFDMGAGAAPMGEASSVRTCAECGCTEANACVVKSPFGGAEEGCRWDPKDPTRCTGCTEPETLVRGPLGGGALFAVAPLSDTEIADFKAAFSAAGSPLGRPTFLPAGEAKFGFFTPQPPRTVSFHGPAGVALTVHLDPFRIEIAEGVQVDAAARVFVDQVSRLAGGSAAWRTDFEYAPSGQANPVDLATYREDTGVWEVFEAWFNDVPEASGDRGWWWAGTGPGDYHADLIINGIMGKIVAWRRKPRPPSAPEMVERYQVTEDYDRYVVRDTDREDDDGRAFLMAVCPEKAEAADIAAALNATSGT